MTRVPSFRSSVVADAGRLHRGNVCGTARSPRRSMSENEWPVPAPLGHRSCKPPCERSFSDSSNTASAFTKHKLKWILRSIGNNKRVQAHISHIKMGFPATYCSICGGPFNNPYTDLLSESPDSKLLDEHVEDKFEVWRSVPIYYLTDRIAVAF
jgi:hypothetical protein